MHSNEIILATVCRETGISCSRGHLAQAERQCPLLGSYGRKGDSSRQVEGVEVRFFGDCFDMLVKEREVSRLTTFPFLAKRHRGGTC